MLDDDSKKKRHGAKQTVDLNEATKRRAEAGVALRQKNTTEALRKMRHFDEFEEETATGPAASGKDPMSPFSYDQKSNPDSIPVELLQAFVNLANSTDANEVVHGVLMLRKLLSRKRDPPVDEMISTGVVPRIVDCMTREDLPALQLEAAWAISNIAACDEKHTRYVMDTRAVEYFIVLLKSSTPAIREQAAWGLGNIAGESAELRDVLLHRYQVLPRLLECIVELAEQRGTSNVDVKAAAVLQNTTWALSSCCRQRPLPDLEAVAPAIPVLCYLLQHPSPGVVGDALWALGYICDGGAERVNRVLQSGCLPKVVEFLSNTDCAICLPAARIVGNVASGSESQTDMLLNAGVLSIFEFIIRHPMRLMRREVVWTLSNMMAGCERHVQEVLAADLFPRILEQARSHDRAIVKEAAMCILNSSSLGTAQQLEYMVSRGVLATIAELLRAREKRILLAALDSLGNFFAAGQAEMEARGVDENPYVTVFNQTEGVDMLEQLQEVDSQEVASAAADIIVNFYSFEEVAGGDSGAAAGPIAF